MSIKGSIRNSNIYQILFENVLNRSGVCKTKDLTYGRRDIPKRKEELELINNGYLKIEKYITLEVDYYPYTMIIYYQCWEPSAKDVKVNIIRVHGMGDHSGRFMPHIKDYLDKGFTIHLFDFPGHGRSDGIHGYVHDFEELIKTLDIVINHVKEGPKRKLFLFGGSMGGLASLIYSIRFPNKIDGMNLFCPALRIEESLKPQKFVLKIGSVLNYIIPRMTLSRLDPKLISDNTKTIEDYLGDPLAYTKGIRISTGRALLAATEYLQKNAYCINTPFLIQQGLADLIVNYEACQPFCDLIDFPDKKILFYDGCHHSISGDKNYASILKDSFDWIIEHSLY